VLESIFELDTEETEIPKMIVEIQRPKEGSPDKIKESKEGI
jgi:hypothetical protein